MDHEMPTPSNSDETTSVDEVSADAYDAATREGGWDSPARAQKLVEDRIVTGATVLDIGIGTGQAVRGYTQKGATVIGFDRDPEMLIVAQTVTDDSGDMRPADINAPLPIDDLNGKVDVVQAIGVLEFADNLESVMKQVGVVLKQPDGVFVFTVETPGADRYPGVYQHSAEEISALLESIGLKLKYDEAYQGYDRGNGTAPYHIFLAQKDY